MPGSGTGQTDHLPDYSALSCWPGFKLKIGRRTFWASQAARFESRRGSLVVGDLSILQPLVTLSTAYA
jgi:hypothetical protein